MVTSVILLYFAFVFKHGIYFAERFYFVIDFNIALNRFALRVVKTAFYAGVVAAIHIARKRISDYHNFAFFAVNRLLNRLKKLNARFFKSDLVRYKNLLKIFVKPGIFKPFCLRGQGAVRNAV